MKRLALYFNTLRYLRSEQVAYQLKRRLFPRRPPLAGPPISFRRSLQYKEFLPAPEPVPVAGKIAFIGISRSFDIDAPDWTMADASKLWRYNLHYFDFLGWTALTPHQKAVLIESWIATVPVGAEDAWEPYTTSLRVVNWLKYLLSQPFENIPERWLASLAHQLAALEHDLEYHLLANHLLKNGKALAFAGMCLEGPAARRWLALGLEIALTQGREQVLADGGHFERSPMYHCIVLEDYLDLCNLGESNPGAIPREAIAELREIARRATDFLRGMLTGSGDIPLFNDAAFGIAPRPQELLIYAGSSAGEAAEIHFPQTGYFGYRRGGDSLIIDGGPVGPDYQPGHAHCDTLSYELHVDGVPVVTDSGTFDYEAGAFRHYLRSTEAHATVRIDGQDQSEIWGAFRVGRRAKPLHVKLTSKSQGELLFEGEHDGYRRLPGEPLHRREIRTDCRARWEICDLISGRGPHRVENFIPLHPAVRCEDIGGRQMRLLLQGGTTLRLTFGPQGVVRRAKGWYCPRFGAKEEREVLVLEHNGALPSKMSYVFERL